MANDSQDYTVRDAFYEVLRRYGVDKIFGNPGSTEQPMLQNFPSDIQYVLALQETSAVAMAGGYAEASRGPAVVSLHTSAGTGNGMGALITAFEQKIPLIVIAGQQTREMLIGEPLLTNRDALMLPRPYVKWSYQPERALDVPASLMRAFAVALQPPAGPVYLSIPLDDWSVKTVVPPPRRTVSTRIGPDPQQLHTLADQLAHSSRPALVLGPEVDKSLAWDAAIQLAESLKAPVFQSPFSERAVFPETHELFKGPLPAARGPLSQRLAAFDFVLVVGAEVFRYYPWVAGPVLPKGVSLVQITNDPNDAAKALVGDSILSDVRLALEGLNELRKQVPPSTNTHAQAENSSTKDALAYHNAGASEPGQLMSPFQAFTALSAIKPANAVLVHETPSNTADLLHAWPSVEPESCFTFASGGLGWNAPAAIGIALAHKSSERFTVAVIGDGSFQYAIQCVWTAVQEKAKIVYVVPVNEQYAVLKEFAVLEATPGVPGLDLPGLDIIGLAASYGCRAFEAHSPDKLQAVFREALAAEGPSVIEVSIDKTLRPLVAQTKPGA